MTPLERATSPVWVNRCVPFSKDHFAGVLRLSSTEPPKLGEAGAERRSRVRLLPALDESSDCIDRIEQREVKFNFCKVDPVPIFQE
jgi:hypothetical protein